MSRYGPFFKLYPADWLADMNVAAMTLEQQGAYIRLLCHAWREGHLPNDPDKMARLLAVDPLHFRADLWPALEGCFVLKDGRLVNPRLEKERREYQRISEAGRIGGRASAAARQTKPSQQDGTIVQRSPNEKASKSDVRSQMSETTEVDADASTSGEVSEWPDELGDVSSALAQLEFLNTDLNDPAWWRKTLAWLDSTGFDIYAITELKNYAAWWESQSQSKRHKNLKRGFRNWLSTAVRWKEREQQRAQIGKRYTR